ncbi:MAG: cobalamin-dependent protein, partial [Patescibacteria group bacterium]|nr:cobalamin-dependent protein [Patescibacteria group bacterium]
MRLTLINTNRMVPPIAPVGLDYVASAARAAGASVDVVDLCLATEPRRALRDYFTAGNPSLVGLSFRNIDDCFWPGGAWFVPDLASLVETVRTLTDAPIVLGGVGYSIFARQVLDYCNADFGIRGDGEAAVVALLRELHGERQFERVDGLLWRHAGRLHANAPAWPARFQVPTFRDSFDNATYFRLGGQLGVETKRGCNRHCVYCADPLAKGTALRLRDPEAVADEFQSLLSQGVDVIHLCDAEFNLPATHAREVCEALIRRRLGQHVRWYAYLTVVPFDADLADKMRRAGCVGINFTSDAASQTMLSAYGQPHRPADLANAVRCCREHGIAVMTDLL